MLSRLDLRRSTRDNCRMSLSESQFFGLHSKTRKAYDILVLFENNYLLDFIKCMNIKNFTENSAELCLKQRHLPAQEKQFIFLFTFPSMGNHQHINIYLSKNTNLILRPNSYVGGRQIIHHSTA